MQHTTTAFVAFGLALGLVSGVVAAADLEVQVMGVEHDGGNVRFTLYDGPEGFRREENSIQVLEHPAVPGVVSARFEGLEPGTYAIIAYHDENGDGQLNRFMGMIPTEGYGLSNNPRVMGPPRFEQAAFDLGEEGMTIEIRLNY